MAPPTWAQIMELVKELRKPDDVTQQKLDEEAAKKAKIREQSIQLATIEIETKRRAQANCDHKKENGKPAFGGQVHSDGMLHPICLHCGLEADPIAPARELLAQ